MARPVRVLFVCMGNICRSPTAHGVMRAKIGAAGRTAQIEADSAATHAYHVGSPPDLRSQEHARRRGYDLSDLRARSLGPGDFERADLLLVMDDDNDAFVQRRCPAQHRHKVHRLTEYCTRHRSAAVPDPYAGGEAGFERVLDLVEDACDGVLQHLQHHPSDGSA